MGGFTIAFFVCIIFCRFVLNDACILPVFYLKLTKTFAKVENAKECVL